MQSAPIPDNEEQRLSDLLSYDILDTEEEALFDEITALASQICDSPIALISLVDPDRQWFKSKVGLDASETSRNIAFCAHAILQDEVFEVPDTLEDARFCDNPLVTGAPSIRAYAGAPLITPSGAAIGTLCAISDKPGALTEQQRLALVTLSHSVVAHLELRRKNRELARTNQFKSDFLAYVSHEVRTPLNAINTLSGLLEAEAKSGNMPTLFQESLGHVRKSGERLLETVNSVLDLKQIEAKKMKLMLRPVSASDFFAHIFSLIRLRAEEQSILFHAHVDDSIPDVIELDDTKFSQIALNVLTNAIKYTPANKHVRAQAFYRDGNLRLVVQDEGIGIAESEQKHLFQPFERMENASQFDGAGLGLMITKGIVELMKGNIRLSSQLHRGTTVSITVPVSAMEIDAVASDTGPVFAKQINLSKDKTVLVVEDNEINQIVISTILDKLQVSHEVVETGEQCVEYLHHKRPDLILMDINLPGISGEEATRQVKQHDASISVVALTADVVTDKSARIAAGLDDVLTKPIDSTELTRLLNLYLADET